MGYFLDGVEGVADGFFAAEVVDDGREGPGGNGVNCQPGRGGNPAEPRSLNRYAYAFNNPVNYTDPSGHMPPQTGGNGPLYSGGSVNAPQVNGNGANPFFNQPVRSANSGNWSTYSNPLSRFMSEGIRPMLCGMAGLMVQGLEWVMQNPDLAIGAAIIASSIALTGGAAIPAIIIGAVIGAGIGYGFEVYNNYQSYQQDKISVSDMFTKNIDLNNILRAAFHGAVSGAIAGVIEPFFAVGSGLTTRVGATAVGEFISGRASQVAANVMIGRGWDEDFWNLGDIALDVLPGVGATLIKPMFKGAKNFISGATDRWRLTQRLDDFVTRGKPVNPLNRLKAGAASTLALAGQVARGVPGAPSRLFSILRHADRGGWNAFWKAGLQPDYVTRLNRFAQANNLEIGFRASKHMSALWRLFDLPAKPLNVKAKTRFGIVRGPDGRLYRSDMDLAYIKSRTTGELLSDTEVAKRLGTLNQVAAGKVEVAHPEFGHPTHWTYNAPGKIGHPGSLFVLNAGADSGLIPKERVRAFAENRGLPWYWDPPRRFYDAQGKLTTGRYTISGEKMAPHLAGSTTSGKSQFLFHVDAQAAVLDAAHHADAYNLWVDNKAKVFIRNGPVGILGHSGELTDWINIYRTNKGMIHGSPGSPP